MDRPLARRTVFMHVGIAAAIVVVGVSLAGSVASRHIAEREAVTDAARDTGLLADAVVQPALTDSLLRGDPQTLARMDGVVRTNVLTTSVVRVKIWTPDGKIVYSDESRLVGEQFRLDADARGVLSHPKVKAEVSNLSRPENRYERGLGKLLEVYRPVWTPSGQPLLFETYSPYDDVRGRSSTLWRGFAGVTVSSLLVLLLLLLPILWRLLDRVQRAQTQRVALLQRAVDASDDERRRIAGTLHDGVVQELVGASLAVGSAAEMAVATGDAALVGRLDRAAGTVRASIRSLRSLLVDIYPPSLTNAGLVAALMDLADGVRARGLDVECDLDGEIAGRLDPAQQRTVFRIAQECLRNAAQHSEARHVRMSLREQPSVAVLEIGDDGVGFDASTILSDAASEHFGLRVVTDVAAESGATLLLSTAPGEGCRWQLQVPLG